MRILDTIPGDDSNFQAIATARELRGQGDGSALIDAIEDRARVSGSTRLSLHVSAKNQGARKLYERRGMAVES